MAHIVWYEIAKTKESQYLMPWEIYGAMAFRSKEHADVTMESIMLCGLPDRLGKPHRCRLATVTHEFVPKKCVRMKLPEWAAVKRKPLS